MTRGQDQPGQRLSLRDRIGLGVFVAAVITAVVVQCQVKSAPPLDTTRPATASAAPAVKVGGRAHGVTLVLPPGWLLYDSAQEESPVIKATFELYGADETTNRRALQLDLKSGFLYAYDATVTQGIAPMLEAGCDDGGVLGGELGLHRGAIRQIHEDVTFADLTVSGRPAFLATYTSRRGKPNIRFDHRYVAVELGKYRHCFLRFKARSGDLPRQVGEVISSFALA